MHLHKLLKRVQMYIQKEKTERSLDNTCSLSPPFCPKAFEREPKSSPSSSPSPTTHLLLLRRVTCSYAISACSSIVFARRISASGARGDLFSCFGLWPFALNPDILLLRKLARIRAMSKAFGYNDCCCRRCCSCVI